MSGIVAKETFTHGTKDFNFAAYPHSYFDAYPLGFDAHWHDEWEIIYVRDGVFRFYVDGKLYEVRKNQALFIDPYAIHVSADYEIGNGSGYNCFVFGRQFLCPDSESYIYRRYFQQLDSNSISLTQRITGRNTYEKQIVKHLDALDDLSQNPEQNALPIQIALLSVFSILLKEQAYSNLTHQTSGQNELVKKALLSIKQNYLDSLTVQSLAALLNVNTDYFIRIFKKTVGVTPKQYIQNLRIQKAVSLMQYEPETSVSDIAQRTGFHDANYFSRSFKKMTGVTPTQYMQQFSQEYQKS